MKSGAIFFLLSLGFFGVVFGHHLFTEVLINSTNVIPEGLDYSEEIGFVISSIGLGQVQRVNYSNGAISSFTDDSTLLATVGIRFINGLLYVCNSGIPPNGSAPNQGGLSGFNATTGETVFNLPLAGIGNVGQPRFFNDIVYVEPWIYLTESIGGQIYRIDNSTNPNATVWSANDLYKAIPDPTNNPLSIGIDGLDHFPGKNYLLGVRLGAGNNSALIKIPLDNPSAPVQVPISFGEYISGSDGSRYGPDGDFYVVGNQPANKVYQVHSDDDFATAEIVGVGDVPHIGPTSPVVSEDEEGIEVYVVTCNGFAPGNFYLEYIPITPVNHGTTGTTSGGDGNTNTSDGSDGSDSDSAARISNWLF